MSPGLTKTDCTDGPDSHEEGEDTQTQTAEMGRSSKISTWLMSQ